MPHSEFMPLPSYERISPVTMAEKAAVFYQQMKQRRTVRDFAPTPVPLAVIENCLLTAGTAPNGANLQPWHFVVVADPERKRRIREAAEAEEREFYERRATPEWLDALAPLGTDARKPFLEIAPYLIVIFAQSYGLTPTGERIKHYYVQESVGIATGLLITAVHQAGLVSLTHTPSPMNFLNEICERPKQERPYLILVVGFPAEQAQVPVISKKSLEEMATFL